MSYEIIKIDAELAECPDTGVRYFGYVKYRDCSGNIYWHTHQGFELPWFQSEEAVLESIDKYDFPDILQIIILKAELPIKKLIIGGSNE